MSLFHELKRRNVIRVGVMYIIVAWLILQVADVVLGNIAAPGWVFLAILLLLVLGLPVAILFAWAFELTPQGLKREEDTERSESVTRKTGRNLDRTIILVLAIALSYFAYDKYSDLPVPDEALAAAPYDQSLTGENPNDPAAATPNAAESIDVLPFPIATESIAVLPFVNMSSDPEQEYFSDGIAEELLNLLAKIPQFRVAGRTSSFAFRGKEIDLREIGSSLGVSSILEGSVRKGGERVRITAQLVNTEDGFHLWSETYDRELSDIFAVQDEIAAAVVEQLKVTLLGGPIERRGGEPLATNIEAYDAYLKGMSFMNKLGPSNFRQAADYFEQTVLLAPNSALAWARLSYANTRFATQAQDGIDSALARARQAAARALELDDAVPDAHMASAFIDLAFDWDWNRAEVSLMRALVLRPGDITTRSLFAELYSIRGDEQVSISMKRGLVARDPLNLQLQARLFVALTEIGESQESENIIQDLLSKNPSSEFLHGYLAFNLGRQGRLEEALQAAERESNGYMRLMNLAVIHQHLGHPQAAKAAQQELLQEYGDSAAYQQAMIFSEWGEFEEAIDWLERAFGAHDPGLPGIKAAPSFIPLHANPRYIAILRKMNLAG